VIDEHFRTFDMALAVSLQLNGFTPVLERAVGEGGRIYFCFNPQEATGNGALESLIEDYESEELLVEPKRFVSTQKKLRERLYDLTGGRLEGNRDRV
jgi:Domain of unknown function (DUF5659)